MTWAMYGNPRIMDESWMEIHVPLLKKIETGRSDSQNCIQKDGYGPIFDHSPLLELKQNEVRSIMSDI